MSTTIVRYWVERFHQDFLDRGGTEATWESEYWKMLKTLPSFSPLTPDLLHQMVINTKPNTRQRRRATMVAGAIAKFAKIDYDPKPYQGKYSSHRSMQTRNLPDDDLIVQCHSNIKNPGYRWIFGMMATYGLRPHECFRIDFTRLRQGDPVLLVLEQTKTGSREVWPFHPEWFEHFDLAIVTLPAVNLDRTNESLGRSVSSFFRKQNPLPFKPYDLRHRWAVRTMEYGLPDALSARQMGHSLEIHNKVYQRWINRFIQQRTYDSIMNNPNRPTPPG